jgi:hypothetical protein
MADTSQESFQVEQEKKMQDFLAMELSLQAIVKTAALPNHCFDNAWRTFFTFPEVFTDGWLVEGWLVFDLEDEVILTEHGWTELRGGAIVDPSILLLVEFDQPVYYFPGVRRGWEEMLVLTREQKALPYVRFDGEHGADGLGHPAYKAAHDAARQKVLQLAHMTTPPKKMTHLALQDYEPDVWEEVLVSTQFVILSSEQHKGDRLMNDRTGERKIDESDR